MNFKGLNRDKMERLKPNISETKLIGEVKISRLVTPETCRILQNRSIDSTKNLADLPKQRADERIDLPNQLRS